MPRFPKMGRVVSRLWPKAAIARKLKAVLAGLQSYGAFQTRLHCAATTRGGPCSLLVLPFATRGDSCTPCVGAIRGAPCVGCNQCLFPLLNTLYSTFSPPCATTLFPKAALSRVRRLEAAVGGLAAWLRYVPLTLVIIALEWLCLFAVIAVLALEWSIAYLTAHAGVFFGIMRRFCYFASGWP